MVKKIKIKMITPTRMFSQLEMQGIDKIIKVKIGDKIFTIEEVKNDNIKRNRKLNDK